MFDEKDIKEHKMIAAVGYLGILCLAPLLLAKESPFAQYHARQALLLFLAEVVVTFVNIIPVLGQLFWLIACVYFLIMSFTGLFKAADGQKWEMPILGKYADKVKL